MAKLSQHMVIPNYGFRTANAKQAPTADHLDSLLAADLFAQTDGVLKMWQRHYDHDKQTKNSRCFRKIFLIILGDFAAWWYDSLELLQHAWLMVPWYTNHSHFVGNTRR